MQSLKSNKILNKSNTKEKNIIENPFFFLKENNEKKNINKIFILCLKDDVNEIDNMFFDKSFSKKRYEKSFNEYILIEGNINMMKTLKHQNFSAVINKSFIEPYNRYGLKLDDENIVICIPNIVKKDLELYKSLYSKKNTLDDYIKLQIMQDYFSCNKNYNLASNTKKILYSLDEFNYWTNPYNCKLNMTNVFIKRKFNLQKVSYLKLPDEAKKAIDCMKNERTEKNDYLNEHLSKKKLYVDVSSSINKNGYTLYKIIDKLDDDVTFEEINELFSCLDSNKERFEHFLLLLTSKKYCHLVGLNSWLLKEMQQLINKNLATVKLFWGYFWLCMCLEEGIKKSQTKITSRCCISSDVGHLLPFFPYCSEDAHMNPYNAVTISEKVLDFKNNLQGLKMISNYEHYGISTIDEFKRNFNIFSSNTVNMSIFEGLDWTNVAITGSTMLACIPKRNPLTKLFSMINNEKDMLFRYYQEYYPNSDIDMMCNCESIFDYIDKAYQVYEVVKNNVKLFHMLEDEMANKHIKIVPYKTLTIIVSKKYVSENLKEYDIDYLIKNKNTDEVKELFYKQYISTKTETNSLERKKYSSDKYKDHYAIVSLENTNIVFTDYEINNLKENKKSSINKYFISRKITNELDLIDEETDDNDDDDTDKNNTEVIFFKLSENLKYKIESQFLIHKIEFFQTQTPDFLSFVSRFYLPCVRAFYNGDKFYMLPTAVTAYLTFMNWDYKYFSSSQPQCEIISKYRTRGIGTLENDKEKIDHIKYISNVEKWKKLTSVNIKNTKSVDKYLGGLELSNKIFKPRGVNSELYHECFPVDTLYNDNTDVKYIDTVQDLEYEYRIKYGYNLNKLGIDILKMKTINEHGYVNPIKQWVIKAVIDNINY